jgi:hypothetical protein
MKRWSVAVAASAFALAACTSRNRRVTERMAATIPDSRTTLVGGGHFIDPGEPDVLKFVGEILGR